MKNLEYMRGLRGYSVDNLAEMIKASAADVKAWEAGEHEPDLAQKRDLAMLLGVDIDYLSGRPGASKDSVLQYLRSDIEDDELETESEVTGYWGQVGIKLRGEEYTKWYPVSHRTASSVEWALSSGNGKLGLVKFETLNNRVVIFRTPAVERVLLLDEACDEVHGDWNVGVDDVEGKSLEVYRALARRMLEEDIEDESAIYQEIVDKAIKDFGLKFVEDYRKLLSTTYVHTTSVQAPGHCHAYEIEGYEVFDICQSIDARDTGHLADKMLSFNQDPGLTAYYNWSDIAVIDAPLLTYLDIRKEHEEHFQEHYHDEEIDGDF